MLINGCVHMHVYTGSNKPTIELLSDYIKEVAPKWYHLGKCLLKEEWTHKLNAIENNNPNNAEKCCIEMLEYWLKSCAATWNKLIDALEKIHQDVPIEMIKIDNTIKGFCNAYIGSNYIAIYACLLS